MDGADLQHEATKYLADMVRQAIRGDEEALRRLKPALPITMVEDIEKVARLRLSDRPKP